MWATCSELPSDISTMIRLVSNLDPKFFSGFLKTEPPGRKLYPTVRQNIRAGKKVSIPAPAQHHFLPVDKCVNCAKLVGF